MNAAAFSAISACMVAQYVGPINPPAVVWQQAWSRLQRLGGRQGSFFFFSERRLKTIAREVQLQCRADARLDFFHGFTPWVATCPERPYIAWSDCTFHDYIDIFHRRELFRPEDLLRIQQAEAAWLRNAIRVLFTSEWAARRAVRDYSLNANFVGVVGIFGELEMPSCDAYSSGNNFVFASTNFEAKGGRIVLEAFREVKRRHPDALLTIVGDRPAHGFGGAGVTFAGFLHKEIPGEYQRFQEILSRSRALVNASRSDVCPVLLVEAGYVGCPVISTRRFAIPEIIDDGRTGLLLDDPSPSAMACAMNWMLEHKNEYHQMREAAWIKARTQYSKKRFEERLRSQLRNVVCEDRVLAL